MHKLHNYIGDPVIVTNPINATDTAKVSSDCLYGVPIQGCSGVLFYLAYGHLADDGTATYSITYSSTGLASDAAASNAGMTCTDAVLTYSTATTSNGGIVAGWFDVSAKGLSDRVGKLFATVAATHATGTARSCLIAIPVIGTGRFPVTAASSNVTEWTSVA